MSVDDLELLHFYVTATAPTLGDVHLWRDEAPKLGYEYPFIFHIMLSLSAYHLARHRPSHSSRYLLLAEQHFDAAVRRTTDKLPYLNIKNCQALYIATVLICFTAFAKGPKPGDLLLTAQQGCVPWLSLLRGVRLVLNTIGTMNVLSGILTPVSQNEKDEVCDGNCLNELPPLASTERNEFRHQGWDWRRSLERVTNLVKTVPNTASTNTYDNAIEHLTRCFESTWSSDYISKEGKHGEFFVIMAWVYSLDPDFLERLARRESVAVIILGHFATLVETLERYWFIEGWGDHILREARQLLCEEYSSFLP